MQGSDIVNREGVYNSLYTHNNQIFISKSPFSAFENKEDEELVYRGRTSNISMEHIMMQVRLGYVKLEGDGIDLEILKALNELEFATSRMITIYLNLIGIEVKQEKVHKRLRYLNKIKIISSYEFWSKDEHGNVKKSHVPAYFLDIAGVDILRSREIKCYWTHRDTIRPKHGIKEALARNQLMLNYLVNITNIDYAKIKPMYKLSSNEELIPHLQIVLNHDNNQKIHIFFEVVRTFNGWKDMLLRRLNQFHLFYDEFTPSRTITNPPLFIIVAESDNHAFNILKTIIDYEISLKNVEYLFTTDARVISDDISKSIAKYNISLNEDGTEKTEIVTLNFKIFDLLNSHSQ